MLKLFMTLTFLFTAATLVQANTVCRNVNGKIYCYDSDTDTSTVCRTVNGALVCD